MPNTQQIYNFHDFSTIVAPDIIESVSISTVNPETDWEKISETAQLVTNRILNWFDLNHKDSDTLMFIINELIENVAKYGVQCSNALVMATNNREAVVFESTNTALPHHIQRLGERLAGIRKMIQNENELNDLLITKLLYEDEGTSSGGLGMLLLIKDYTIPMQFLLDPKTNGITIRLNLWKEYIDGKL